MGTLPQSAALGILDYLKDLCGCSRPLGPPWSACDAYVGRVCHYTCGGDRSSRRSVCPIWVNGSFGGRTIATSTPDSSLITSYYIVYSLLHCIKPVPHNLMNASAYPPPPGHVSWVPAAKLKYSKHPHGLL